MKLINLITHEKDKNILNGKQPEALNSAHPHVHHSKYFSTTVRPNFSWTSLGVSIWNTNAMSNKMSEVKVH
jgi:hypothetical protein